MTHLILLRTSTPVFAICDTCWTHFQIGGWLLPPIMQAPMRLRNMEGFLPMPKLKAMSKKFGHDFNIMNKIT